MPKASWKAVDLEACQKEVTDWKGPRPQDPIGFCLKCLAVSVGIISMQGFVSAVTGDTPPFELGARTTGLTCVIVTLGGYVYQRRVVKKWWNAVDNCLTYRQK